MVSGLRGACKLAGETDAYTVNTGRKEAGEGGEHVTNQPSRYNENTWAQMPGTKLEFQLSGRVDKMKPSQVWG